MKKVLLAALMALTFAQSASAICPGGPATLTAPADNDNVTFNAVTLQWTNVTGASYEVYFSVDGGSEFLAGTTGIGVTSKFLNGLQPGRTYTWKVGAVVDTCPTQYSTTRTFHTSCPTIIPVLQEPDQGEVFAPGEIVTFNWTPMAGATSYDVKVTPDFGVTFETIAENITTTSFSTADLGEGDWGWHVRVNFDGACGPFFSQPSSFLINACAGAMAPAPLSPANNATVSLPTTFQWSNVGADDYQLMAQRDGGAPRSLGTTRGTSMVVSDLDAGEWDWWVIAKRTGCGDMSSNKRSVNVQGTGGCPTAPGKATLVSPAANATNLVSPVLFDWNPVANATGYRVLVAFANGESEVVGTTNANTTQLSATLRSGTGLWFVQTLFGDDCPTTLSDRRGFTVTQGTCPTTAPQLIAPANGSVVNTQPVTFDWSDVPNAIGYSLYVATGDRNEFALYGNTDAGTSKLERLVPAGEIDWFVVARFTGCPDVRSAATFGFRSGTECHLGPVQFLTPAAGTEVNSPVTISWTPVQNASQYRVTLKNENGAILLSSRMTQTSISQPLPAGTFIVQVEALKDGCTSSTADRRFTVKLSANCATNGVPVLVSPVGTETQPATAQSPVTLTWNPVANALAYRVWVAHNDEPFQDVALTTQTHDEVQLEPGRYRWFIQAFFEGCEPTRSNIAFFNVPDNNLCTRVAPQIITPANNATVTSPVTIDWSDVPGARKYRVLALVNDKPTLLGTTTEESELTLSLFPGDYVILVQAEFASCAATESERTRFTVRRAQGCPTEPAQLVAPSNGATNVDSDVEFVWLPVSGAIEYVIVAKVNDGAETVLGRTDGTHFRARMPAGKILWTVIAIVPGCDALRAAPFTFTVARAQNCTDRKPVLLFPTADSGDVPSPVEFVWIGVPNATEYRIWVAQGSPAATSSQAGTPEIVATTTEQHARVDLPPGRYRWFAEARFANCPSTFSAEAHIIIVEALPCDTPRRPEANVIGQAVSGVAYRLRWTPLPNVSKYEVQESTSADFENATSFTAFRPSLQFNHDVTGVPVKYLYRVRGVSDCSDARGPYSEVVGVFVIDPKTNNPSSELGTDTPVTQKVFLPGGSGPVAFSATTDKPWLTVTPAAGTIPPEGLTLNVTADPDSLGLGTNTATLRVTRGAGAAKGITTNDETTIGLPLSLSLVTPVTPSGKGTPPPDALIFGAVGHAAGLNDSLFESDIRLTNLTAQTKKYDLNFTPSGVDGTQEGITSTIEVPPGVTMALDDVVATAFGSGTVGSSLGMLEIRPAEVTEQPGGLFGSINDAAQQQIQTVASSRTYNFTPAGTFGQYIPATPFANFVGRGTILSMQQVAQSLAFRANFGFLEASGQPAELVMRVYDTANNLLSTIPVSLGAMQHRQLNGLLQNNGINDLVDGRVEVEVISGDGKITAYVSEVDNATNDPLLVPSAVKGAVKTDRYIVPGMAYINTGAAFWVSDLRIFNAGTTATPATLTFYPMGNPGGAMSHDITLNPGEIEVLNNVLVNTFGVTTTTAGGSIVITTPAETSLTATARTYNQTPAGTYGQYIAGVTVADSVGLNDRALQILQVEQSTRIRTNIGLNETTGKPVTVEVSLIAPDLLTTPVVTIGLQANEFRQIGLLDFGLPDAVYNGRVTIKVVGGEGRVTGYGSAIDQITQDPTYVPPQ